VARRLSATPSWRRTRPPPAGLMSSEPLPPRATT